MTFFLFDEVGLLTVIGGMFFAGFLPMLILLMLCPEARQHLKCRITGGIIVAKFTDLGSAEYLVAKPKGGEGQFIAGKDAYGQRQVFVKPRMDAGFVAKFFMLKGMRRPIALWYSGKTALANPETLAAIEVAKIPIGKRGNLPPEIQAWAKENELTLQEPVTEEVSQEVRGPKTADDPVGKFIGLNKSKRVVGSKDVIHTLFTLDPRELKQYFSDHYDESQYDNLLEAARVEGLNEGREGKRLHISKGMIIGIILVVVAVVGIVVLKGLGVF